MSERDGVSETGWGVQVQFLNPRAKICLQDGGDAEVGFGGGRFSAHDVIVLVIVHDVRIVLLRPGLFVADQAARRPLAFVGTAVS